MPKINLLTLQPGDSQSTLIDKINYNYDQLLTAGGGPQGIPGRKGATGGVGPQGSPGVTGPQGQEGSKWFVDASNPTSGSPLGVPISGDYWLRDSDKEILRYGPTGAGLDWIASGYNLRADQLFSVTGSNWNTSTSNFDSRVVYYSKNDVEDFSLLLADWGVDGTGPDYSGATLYGLNSEKSKLKIATSLSTHYSNLISFGRTNLDSSNNTSSTFSNTHNPVIKWATSPGISATAGTPNIWDVRFYNPIGSWDIVTTGGNIGISSSSLNKIETSGITGGTIINFAATGYFQVLPSGSTGSSSTPYFGVSAVGAGVKTAPGPNSFTVKGSASFATNDIFNAYALTGGHVLVEKGLRIGVTGAAGNALSVKGSSSVALTDSFSSYSFATGYMGIESGLRIGATGWGPYGVTGATGPGMGATGYLLGATNAFSWSPTGTYVTPKVLLSGKGNGAVFQARLDPTGPSAPNAWLSWGDSTIYPFDNSIINNLSQEYLSATGPIATGTFFAGYYHGAGNATGVGSYSSASAGTPDPITQFQIVSEYGVGTHISTYGKGDLLNLNARQYGPTAANARVTIGANNNNTMKVYDNSIRVTSTNSTPLDRNTILSVEDTGWGCGTYFGYRPGGAAFTQPSAKSYWPSGCIPTTASISWINRIKVLGDPGQDGMNGIGIAYEYDTTPGGGSFSSFCPSGDKSYSKAFHIDDYDHYTRNGSVYTTITWDGRMTLGRRTRMIGGSTITQISYDPGLASYGPDVAHLFVYGDGSFNGTVRAVGGFAVPSSRKLKDRIFGITSGIEKVSKLNPVEFDWKSSGKHDVGFIADEIFEIIPEAATISPEGEVDGYEPAKLIPILTKSIQELIQQVNSLKQEVELLKSK